MIDFVVINLFPEKSKGLLLLERMLLKSLLLEIFVLQSIHHMVVLDRFLTESQLFIPSDLLFFCVKCPKAFFETFQLSNLIFFKKESLAPFFWKVI